MVRKQVEEAIIAFKDLFDVQADRIDIKFDPSRPYEDISEKMAVALSSLRKSDAFVALRGWRNEDYEIRSGGFDLKPLFRMERSATGKITFVLFKIVYWDFSCSHVRVSSVRYRYQWLR